jgi:hypothetical protein
MYDQPKFITIKKLNMKKIITASTILFCLVIVCSRSLAQAEKDPLTFKTATTAQQYLFTPKTTNFIETNKNDINAKAVRKFTKIFKAVMDEKWYTTSNDFVASFNKNGVNTEVYYNKKGIWLYNFLTYHEAHLPTQVGEMIKSSYPGYDIFVAYEYQFEDGPVHIIKLKNCKTFKTVLVLDGTMKVIEEYKQI